MKARSSKIDNKMFLTTPPPSSSRRQVPRPEKFSTSLQIFRSFIHEQPDGSLDASMVFSRQCYLNWLHSKGQLESDAEAKKFHRTLTNHVSGVDGRTPFPPDEEKSLLLFLRQKQPWPCFPSPSTLGKKFRAHGFHEKQECKRNQISPITTTTTTTTEPTMELNVLDPDMNALIQRLFDFIHSQPPPPTTPEQLHHRHANTFGLFRMIILSRTPLASVSLDLVHAQELCRIHETSPSQLVVVITLLHADFQNRIVARNASSYAKFGVDFMSANPHSGDLSLVRNMFQAFHEPGKWFYGQKWLRDRTGEESLYKMDLMADPTSLLLVVVCTPLLQSEEEEKILD